MKISAVNAVQIVLLYNNKALVLTNNGTNGAIMAPTLATVEDVPTATDRSGVGKISDV